MVRRPNYPVAQDSMIGQDEQSQRGLADEYYNGVDLQSGQAIQIPPSTQYIAGYTAVSPEFARSLYGIGPETSSGYEGQGSYTVPAPAPSADSNAFSGWGNAAYNTAPVDHTGAPQFLMAEPHNTGAIKTENFGDQYSQFDDSAMPPPLYSEPNSTYDQSRTEPWPTSSQHPSAYHSHPRDNLNSRVELGANPNEPLEQDRGLTGALAGGLAGGYAGHKIHHGFLGTLGGAYAGHKLQEAYQDHNKTSNQHQATVAAAGTAAAAFSNNNNHSAASANTNNGSLTSRSFLHTCTNIRLSSDGHTLKASARRVNGSTNPDAVIDLNKVLTNKDGRFEWVREGGDFSKSAKHAKIEVQDGRDEKAKAVWLFAELRDCKGKWREDRVFLADVVENCDGRLGWIE